MKEFIILVVDDEKSYRELYAESLANAGFSIVTAASAEEASGIISDSPPSMVISDVRMPGKDGISFMCKVKELYPEMPFLLITAFPDLKSAVKALKLGAVDYLEKPVDLDELVCAVSDNLGVRSARSSNLPEGLPAELLKNIICESPALRSILSDAFKVARTDANVLLTGESGAGKEVVARFIHDAGKRSQGPFNTLNCAAIPQNTIASELFGHVKGAFTGAASNRKGLFREAAGGTVFLDEIGDMPLELQPALLRVIETGKVTPLGSDREETADFRLIAATNKNLKAQVNAGTFREDLFYRLNVIAFEIPPLRERPEDIAPLARHFLSLGASSKRFSPSTLAVMQNYSWPGNVRELSNAVERAAILANTGIILPNHLPAALSSAPQTQKASNAVKTMDQAEIEAIKKALTSTGGNRTKAAELLGISRRALIYKLKRYDITG